MHVIYFQMQIQMLKKLVLNGIFEDTSELAHVTWIYE